MKRVLMAGLFALFFYQTGFMNGPGAFTATTNSPSFSTLAFCNNSRNVFINQMATRGISTSSYWTTGCVEVN